MARMKIGVIGLGRMGYAVAYRLMQAGYEVWGFDPSETARDEAKKMGINCVPSAVDLVNHVRIFWLMIPAGELIDKVITELLPSLQQKDVIIDGGNSFFKDSIRRYQLLQAKNVHFLDCGTSGGLAGRDLGFSLMIGGDREIFESLKFVFEAIAAPCTQICHPELDSGSNSHGYAYCGPSGAGHYVKMVHNGVEYALLQAYAEGFHLLKEGHYQELDLAQIADVWNHGAVIRSWILDLAHNVFAHDQQLTSVSGEIGENLTGRWTVDEAKEQRVPVDLIARALEIRAESRQTGGNYGTKVVALLRNQFGGHEVKKK